MKMKIIKMKMNMKMKKMIIKIQIKMKIKMNMNMMMKQWVRTKKNKIIKGLNNNLDEIIDKSKSLKEQTESLEKLEDL